jgi:hypothetical protein
VTINGQALRERRRQGSVSQRSDLGNVRRGRNGTRGHRLVGERHWGSPRNRYDLAAFNVLARALLRRAHQHREQQRRKQNVQQERCEEASR